MDIAKKLQADEKKEKLSVTIKESLIPKLKNFIKDEAPNSNVSNLVEATLEDFFETFEKKKREGSKE